MYLGWSCCDFPFFFFLLLHAAMLMQSACTWDHYFTDTWSTGWGESYVSLWFGLTVIPGNWGAEHTYCIVVLNLKNVFKLIFYLGIHVEIPHCPKAHADSLNWWLELVLHFTVSAWTVDLIKISPAETWDKVLKFRKLSALCLVQCLRQLTGEIFTYLL